MRPTLPRNCHVVLNAGTPPSAPAPHPWGGDDVATQPTGKACFLQRAFGQADEQWVQRVVAGLEGRAVELDAGFAGDGSGTLVAVDEGRVARDAEGACRGKVGEVGRRVAAGVALPGSGKRRVEQGFIAHAAAAAAGFGKLAVVDGHRGWFADPGEGDQVGSVCWASLLSRVRRLRITCSATSICAVSSGS